MAVPPFGTAFVPPDGMGPLRDQVIGHGEGFSKRGPLPGGRSRRCVGAISGALATLLLHTLPPISVATLVGCNAILLLIANI